MTSSSLIDKEQAATLVPLRLRLRSLALPLGRLLLAVPLRLRLHSLALPLGFLLLIGGLAALSGCIADSAEDSDLPCASNKSWEGMAPIAPTMMDRYD